MDIHIHIDVTSLRFYLFLFILNIVLITTILTFFAPFFSSRVREFIHLLPFLIFITNIPFSLVSYPNLAGPLLSWPALVFGCFSSLFGVFCYVLECRRGWQSVPHSAYDDPPFGIS